MTVRMASMVMGAAAGGMRMAPARRRVLMRAAAGPAAVRVPRFVVFVVLVMAVMLVVMMLAVVLGSTLDLVTAKVAAVIVAVGWRRRRWFGGQAALFAQFLAGRLLVVVFGAASIVLCEPSLGRLLVHMAEQRDVRITQA